MNDGNLRKAGLKVTQPRKRILELLDEAGNKHVTADDIYRVLIQAGEDIGLATVYRVLTQFETAGLVTRHHFDGGHAVFEIDDGEHHDHLVCLRCGKIIEFECEEIEVAQTEVAERYGFTILRHRHELYGHCKDCSAEK